ncbi:RNA methyltransferase [Aquimarina sp. D1M17]|uniref:TrmH family RNA methyltransferase n=1 Tax=Aquimarina acroporae TaxID=2937283 RepID=UPI0020C13969|nr:RNA methyltransferase [Aquimarina acroporae]MCK8522189.1 RNA methyltransferase [Aquimarina acroporae]
MVSKNQKKLIKSLHQKKYRKQHHLFVAEGKKVINELLDAEFRLHSLYTVDDSFFKIDPKLQYVLKEDELKQISFLSTPQTALAVFYIPEEQEIDPKGITLVLDDVRDPGNLGTIIRLCDWFGIRELVCSLQTVDCYNPKVIQATMGSISRVNVRYTSVLDFLKSKKSDLMTFGTFMDGDNLYKTDLPKDGIVVMGNEANGISPQVEAFVDKKITIPQFGDGQKTESLNVATATAIVLSEFKRS